MGSPNFNFVEIDRYWDSPCRHPKNKKKDLGSMKLGRTIVFIFLFIIAAGIYLYQKRLVREALTFVPDEVNRSVMISRDDVIDRVELRDHVRKTQIALQKDKGIWMLEVPVRYPAEERIVEGLLTAARMVCKQPRLRAEKEWDEYGLAKPELEILFDLPEKKPVTLRVGAPTPVGKSVFAKWDEERGYFLLPSEMKAAFQQTVYGLREKRIFRTHVAYFRKIFVEMGKNSYQWVKENGEWYWFEPVGKFGQKVPVGRLDPILEALQGLHVKAFQDNNKRSKAELGFFMIHDRIRVEMEDGKTQTFYFGNEVPEENAYYGFREGETTVLLIDRGKVIELLDLLKTIPSEEGERQASVMKGALLSSDILQPAS